MSTRLLITRGLIAAAITTLLAACGGTGTPDGGSGTSLSLQAQGNSAHTVTLSWTRVPGASGYTLERRSDNTVAWVLIATLNEGDNSYLDDRLAPNTAYSYRVAAQGGTAAATARSTTRTTADALLMTAVPAALNTASDNASLGPEGGAISTNDGAVRLSLLPGALAGSTAVNLQATTNPVPDGQGAGVRVRLSALPTQPMSLSLRYEPAMDRQADGLGVALQRADGSWLTLPVNAIDKTERRLTATLAPAMLAREAARPQQSSVHKTALAAASVGVEFHVVRYLNLHLVPREATIATGATQLLVPYAYTFGTIGNLCIPEEEFGCIPSPLVEKREVPFDNQKAGFSRKWLVFADEGGAPGLGTVTPRAGSGAVYRAPQQEPEPNPVLVSFVSKHLASGRTVTLTASIRVNEPVWTMIMQGRLNQIEDIGFAYGAEGIWTREAGNAGTYRVTGTQSVTVINGTCSGTASPDSVPLPPGALVIDRNAQPARYRLDVGSVWNTVVTAVCPDGQGSATAPVFGQLVVEGTLSLDGTTIEGSTSQFGVTWQWALTSRL
jgi:hypothetical protein